MRRLLTLAGLLMAALAAPQLRVATWNLSNYTGGRHADLTTAIFGSFEGRRMQPDVIATQEFFSQAAQDSFLAMLNAGPLGPIWQAAPYWNGPDSDSAFFYRTDRVVLVNSTVISNGGNSPLPPRDTRRFDVVLLGYSHIAPKIAIYACHMKAGTAANDQSRRLAEALAVRTDAQNLSGFDGALVVGDFNLYTSTEDAYVKLTGSESNNLGRFFDPISSPGDWDNNFAFRYIHTQDPSGSAGMDSRFDFILATERLINGSGLDYIGQPTTPYSTVTWNDPAHSYRAWGNDGTSFDNPLTIIGNAMVGPTIAQALVNASTVNGGHLPVFLDLRAPGEIGLNTATLDFGTVVEGSPESRLLQVFNRAETTRWGSGIANLFYQLGATSGFSAPGGTFMDAAGGGLNNHAIGIDTSTPGVKTGTLTVTTTGDPAHQRTVALTGQVVPDQLRPTTWTLERGALVSGSLASVLASDDQRLILQYAFGQVDGIRAVYEFTSPVPTFSTLTTKVESQTQQSLVQFVDLYDFTANQFVQVGSYLPSSTDTVHSAIAANPARFMHPQTKALRLRLRYRLFQASTAPIPFVRIGIDAIGIELR